MTFLFHRAIAVGDNVVAIKAMLMLKKMYPKSKLIVYTNNIGENLYRNLPFIDSIIKDLSQDLGQIDYFFVTHRTKENIAIAKQTNARKIITKAYLHTLFCHRFINSFLLNTKHQPESKNLLHLVRLVDKSRFDDIFSSIDFNEAKLQTTSENEIFVDRFLQSHKIPKTPTTRIATRIANGGGQNSTHRKLISTKRLIGINIFGSGGVRYLSFQSWREIATHLAKHFSDDYIILLCPPNQTIDDFPLKNVVIFKNNSDLLNLVALTKRLDWLISVDTGNVHIADNLQIPTLGLYTSKMFKRWRGGTYGGVFKGLIIKDSESATKESCLTMVKNALS